MYVIFPADEVVYLSYGRLIYVPTSPNSETNKSPIRTSTEIPSDTPFTTSKRTSQNEHSTSAGCSSVSFERPSTSQVRVQQEDPKPQKKKPSRFNFNLLRKNNSPSRIVNDNNTPFSPRLRQSICVFEKPDQLHPEEAFKRFCSPHTPLSSFPEATSDTAAVSSSKKSSIRSSTSSKVASAQEVEAGGGSKRSSKHSSSSSKSTGPKTDKLSPNSSNNSSVKKSSPKPTAKTPGATKSNDKREEPFYPLATSRDRTLIDPCMCVPRSSSVPKEKPVTRLNSFRLPFRKVEKVCEAEVPPVPPERKRTRKVSKEKEKPIERKLSFSDYLAWSREKSDVSVVTKSSEKKVEKSPVLSFFRGKSASPRNLGRDRTREVSFEKSLSSIHISPPTKELTRTSSEQRYRTPSEKSRPRKKKAHFVNDLAAKMANMAAGDSTLKDLIHPAYNEHLKSHNAVAFKLVKTVSDFTQQLSQMYEHHAEEMQMLVATFRKRNGELRKERPACPSSLFHTWEALLQEVEIDSQALGDIASILGRQVSRPMLERSFFRKIQSRKVFTHRESYETILAKTEEKLAKCRQDYKNAYLSYLTNPTTESLSTYFNTHNAYVQQLHATNGMMEEYGKETLPSLLLELEEIYSDLCSTVTDAVIQGAEVVSARALEQSKRYEGLINQCRMVSGPADLSHLARSLPVPQGRGPIIRRIFVAPQPPPPPDGLETDATDGLQIINDSIPPPLKDELVIDQLSAVQIRPSHEALRKESEDLRLQIRQIQDALDTLLRVQQRSAEASLFNKANELQEDISMKKFDLRVAQIHLSAINSQKELFSSKLEGDTGSGRERKMSAASTASMKNKWLKAFKSLKTPPPEVEKKNGAAATRELLKGDPDAHNFHENTYKKITPCDVCSQILRGHTRQGLKCRICKMNVHVDCQEKASKCQTKARLLRRQKSTSEIETREQNTTTEEEKLPAAEVDQIYQVLKQATEISNSKPRVNVVESTPPGITVDRGSLLGSNPGSSGSSGQSLNRTRAPPPPQPSRAAGSSLAVINPAPCSTSSDRNSRHHSQGPSIPQQQPQQQQSPQPQDASSMRRRLFAGMKSLTGFGSRSRHGSPGHRSISLPETPHSPRRQKLNLRMKSLSLDSPESTEHVQRRQRHAAAVGGTSSNPHSDPHSAQGSTSRIQSPSSPVHNRRLLSAKNIRMSSVELPDDNEKSPSSASTSPCPSPVGKKSQRLLPTNLYVVLYNFKSRHQDELDLKAGYKVTVIDTSDPDWWKGKCLGRVGFFPSKYVSKLSSGEKPLQVTHNLQVSDGDNGLMLLRDQIVIQIGEEVDGMVMIRSGDNRQGVCPIKFLQEV